MKTLIVPTDFSAASANAMNYAVDMALNIEAGILLFHAYQIPVAFGDAPVVSLSIEDLEASAREGLEELKKNIERITAGKIKVYTGLSLGDTVDELATLCEKIHPFAVVMGSHGATGVERLIMGSTTLTTIRRLTWPVIVVPPGTEYRKISKIGLACDFRDVIESVPINFIKTLAKQFQAELHVLNIDHNDRYFTANTPLESAYLDTLLEGTQPNYHFLDHEDVVEGINEFAETNNLDLVIVVPKKYRLLEAVFHKSRSRELVTHSHIPIVSIHE